MSNNDPFYLQGSQTGGILQGMGQPQQSYIPSIPGTQPQGYTPGYGQAPYAQQPQEPIPGMNAAVAGARDAAGSIDWPRVQRQLGLTNAQMDQMRQGGTLSSFESPQTGAPAPTGAPVSDGITMIGQDEAWMSPSELGQQTDALGGGSLGGGGGSSGGGGGGGFVGQPGPGQGSGLGSGLGLGNLGAPGGTTVGTINNPSFPTTPTLNYQPPGGAPGQPGGTMPPMQQSNPQAALDAYKNTAGYQLLNAPGAYEQSPGYKYAMEQALGQVQNQASARGMLESGAVLRDMQKTASGLAQQDYGNWWNRQNQLYGDYQNRLQGLAGGPTGAEQAMQTGQNMAQGTYQTGSNLGSLFGNQGSSGMGGIINTGAAQANAITNAGQQQATLNAANQATQLAGATLATQQRPAGLF